MKKLVSHLKSPKVMIFSFTRTLSSRILDSLFRFITCSPVPGRGVAAPPAGAETKPHSENFTLTFNTSSQCSHSGSFSLLPQCTPPAARFLLQPLLSQLSPLINQLFTSTIYYSLSSNWTSFKSTVCPRNTPTS